MPFSFLVGGARSGKSTLAVRVASAFDAPVVVVATAEARDEDMAERIIRRIVARCAPEVIAQHAPRFPGLYHSVGPSGACHSACPPGGALAPVPVQITLEDA